MPKTENPVCWFEIPVTDLARAKKFYESVLEISLTDAEMGPNKMSWFPMHPKGSGATGTLIQGEAYQPSHQGSLVYLSVGSIDDTLKKIDASGGKTLVPNMSIGEHGFIAHFEDCEGNRVALHEAIASN